MPHRLRRSDSGSSGNWRVGGGGRGTVWHCGLTSLVDPNLDEMSSPVMMFCTMAGYYWKDWTRERRRHFIDVVDHEFPDLTADVVDYCQRMDAA